MDYKPPFKSSFSWPKSKLTLARTSLSSRNLHNSREIFLVCSVISLFFCSKLEHFRRNSIIYWNNFSFSVKYKISRSIRSDWWYILNIVIYWPRDKSLSSLGSSFATIFTSRWKPDIFIPILIFCTFFGSENPACFLLST